MADSDRLPILGKIRENLGQVIVVMKLAIVYQEHDRHCSELFADGSQPEIRVLVNFLSGSQVRDSIAALEDFAAVFDNQARSAGRVIRLQISKDIVVLLGRNRVSHS